MDSTTSGSLAPGQQKYPDSPRLGQDFFVVLGGNRLYKRVLLAGAVFACISLVVISRGTLPPFSLAGIWKAPADRPAAVSLKDELKIKQMGSSAYLIDQLKAHSLWEMPFEATIPPVIFANYPSDFAQLEVEVKKKAFLHALLPAILLVQAEVEKEREALERILAKYEMPGQVVFSEEESDWRERLAGPEIEFVEHLAGKYRSVRASDLLARVDILPVSLIMAQAAMESSWGTSRFSKKGNNIFGLWTWGEHGLVPAGREEGKNHKVAVYDSILDSTRAYLLNLNRLPAYRDLRQLRRETRDPLLLADGLLLYSERRQAYVSELRSIIRHNQLDRYDRYSLAGELPAGSARTIKVSKLML